MRCSAVVNTQGQVAVREVVQGRALVMRSAQCGVRRSVKFCTLYPTANFIVYFTVRLARFPATTTIYFKEPSACTMFASLAERNLQNTNLYFNKHNNLCQHLKL